MDEKRPDFAGKLKKLVQFQISRQLVEIGKNNLIRLETLQNHYNLTEEDFKQARKEILDEINNCSRSLIDLVEMIFKG